MICAVAAIATLAQQCAPEIATEAVVPLVMTESSGDPQDQRQQGAARSCRLRR
jgi:hypothetical protein